MKAWLKRNFYRLYYYKKSVKIGQNVLLNTKNNFEGMNAFGKNCEIASCNFGLGSYVSGNSVIKNTTVGRYCSIGSNVQTGVGLHPSETYVATHPAFFSTKKQAGFSFTGKDTFEEHKFLDNDGKYMVAIGSDVWIGSNVIIMDGITIGDGAIVAAGSIVIRDVVSYSIVGGVPAKFMRLRFEQQQVEKLKNMRWWNWSTDEIKTRIDLFHDVEVFTASLR